MTTGVLAEGVFARIVYKAYATGVITTNAEPDPTVDPVGSSGGEVLRRVSTTLSLAKDTYQSNELREDQQLVTFRHGLRRATGEIAGEFSPRSYFPLIEAATRGTKSAAISLTEADLTSCAADNTTSKFTFASGSPTTLGLRVGDIIRYGSLSDSDNNGKNFLVLSFGGTSNRELTVYPAPDTMSADTAFTLTSNGATGKAIILPSTGLVKRKFAFEVHHQDTDFSRLFTECRIGGFTLSLPATGMSTIQIPVLGRNQVDFEDAACPFFVSPTASTTTDVFEAVNGLLVVDGTAVGVVTGITVTLNRSPSSDAVVGQNFAPEVFTGTGNVTGQITAMFESGTLVDNFVNEDEVSVLVYLKTTNAVGSPAVSIHLPRVKFGAANVAIQGQGAQTVTLPFQALRFVGSTAGFESTTMRMVDTEAV